MLVSATLTPAVLAACSQWCPDLQPVIVSADGAGAAEAPALPQLQPAASPDTPQTPQWGWDADSRQPERECVDCTRYKILETQHISDAKAALYCCGCGWRQSPSHSVAQALAALLLAASRFCALHQFP